VGCGKHIEIFKKLGIWEEDGTVIPKPGDIIVFNWNDATQPNDDRASHIGFVEEVHGNTIITIEGNMSEKVGRRTINVGWGYIRGFARPKYADGETIEPAVRKSIDEIAEEVIRGAWGNGDARKKALTEAGYDYYAIQNRVNKMLSGNKAKKSVDEIAKEVIDGRWGNGAARKEALTNAGYDYSTIQNRVNELCKLKDNRTIAKEVINGNWGNGSERKRRLTQAGYDYTAVQKIVNQMLA
jgi:hypothetical protein